MYLSRYTLLYKSETSALLYNTLTRNCVLFGLPLIDISRNDIEYLKENLHIFDTQDDDIAYVKLFINSAKYRNPRFSVTLTMTYECNFDCVYCYEKDMRKTGKMSEQTANEVVEWIQRYVQANPDIQIIDVCFHGGEPFLCYDRIVHIAKNLKNSFSDKELYMHIVTNGSMLLGHGKELESIGIKQIQVTLDGLQAVHDSRRRYKDGIGSFNKIIEGCIDLLSSTKNMRLMVNTVVDKANQSEVNKLKKFCIETLNSDRLFFYFSDIWVAEGNHDIEKSDGSIFQENDKDFQQFDLCTARGLHNYVIDCFGDIYKCITGVGHAEFKIGNIIDSLYKLQISQAKFIENSPSSEKCEACTYYPICVSSCMFNQIKKKTKNICNLKLFQKKVDNDILRFVSGDEFLLASDIDRKNFIALLN